MRLFMNVEPVLGRAFVCSNLFTNSRMKNLSSTAWHRIQATFLKILETIIVAEFRFFEYIIILYWGQPFDMQIGAMGFTLTEKISVKLYILLWNNTTG